MKRRKFLQILGAGTSVTLMGYFSLPSFRNAVKQIVQEDTSSLMVEDQVIEKFLEDADTERLWHKFSLRKKGLLQAHTFIKESLLSLPNKQKYNLYRNQIVTSFLLSTDFFINKMNPNLPVHYVGLYNPYKTSCTNPFSNLHFSPNT